MTDLQELIDERDIARVLVRFAQLVDSKNWDALGDVYAADVCYDYGSEQGEGLNAIIALTRRYLDRCGGTQHLLGSIRIDVDGDHAVSRAYVQARHHAKDSKTLLVFDTNGEYEDRWERRASGWRIVRRDARWFSHSGDMSILAGD